MAEPVGLASELLTVATFAFKSSTTLFKTVQSFQNHPTRVRDLKEELGALTSVLGSLTETVNTTTGIELSALNLPLLRCGKACKEFEQEILKCSSRSGVSRASFRDWGKLRYLGDNIDGFRQSLAGYKSTIIIALTDANLRQSSLTAESVVAYRDLIKTATDDLEAHLQSIDEKFETFIGQTVTASSSDATELGRIKEERMSTQRCLQICAHLSDHINQIQLAPKRNDSSTGSTDADDVPERLIVEGLQECKNSLAVTAAKLEGHMADVIDRLMAKSKTSTTSEEDLADLAKLRDEWDTARQCMNICSKADTHLKESITTVDNYGTGDAIQFMVSTDGKTIKGTNRGLGWRTRQVGGHLSDVSVQKLSADFTSITLRNSEGKNTSPQDNVEIVPTGSVEDEDSPEFNERYGQGFKLPSVTTGDVPTSTASRLSSSPKG